jgi:hypothetical protein
MRDEQTTRLADVADVAALAVAAPSGLMEWLLAWALWLLPALAAVFLAAVVVGTGAFLIYLAWNVLR